MRRRLAIWWRLVVRRRGRLLVAAVAGGVRRRGFGSLRRRRVRVRRVVRGRRPGRLTDKSSFCELLELSSVKPDCFGRFCETGFFFGSCVSPSHPASVFCSTIWRRWSRLLLCIAKACFPPADLSERQSFFMQTSLCAIPAAKLAHNSAACKSAYPRSIFKIGRASCRERV